ncbi:MAG TPA: hypothetical protein VFT99_20775, partial [Roseiflexaceae bacterium]|nr:hypothetical protein [Roseiflexaceae bacterium]
MPPRHRAALFASLALILLSSMLATPAAHAQSAPIRPHPNGKRFARPDGTSLFVLGYNYEGPFDRAWRMWEQFDAGMIGQDLARARGGGANTVRIFVQQPLPAEIMAGDFRKLDTVIDLAGRQGLLVLLTLGDYDSRDLAALAEVNRRIAEHYRGNPTILAYDLRNEPQFLTLASATYPAGVAPGLQRADLVGVYGERISRGAIGAYRASPDGRVLPGWWNDDQVYAYANNLEYFRSFLGDAERWTGAAAGRVITDFPTAPEAQGWQPFWNAMNDTLAAWIDSQRGVLQAGDPGRMLTIGWSNTILARLPANGDRLDFVALHRFPQPSVAAANQIVDLAAGLKRAFPGRPVMLEEIGFATSEIDPDGAAALEMGIALRAYSEGYAGYLKWMLTDLPPVGNPREDTFGALRIDASPKPLFHTLGAFGTYLGATAAEPGGSL